MKRRPPHSDNPLALEMQRGEIKDNALKALVTSPALRPKVVKAKKGKGSYSRKIKNKGREAFFMAIVRTAITKALPQLTSGRLAD